MDIKIINGTIVTASDIFQAEVGIDKGKIVALAEKIETPATQVVDAKGQYILPGAIDVHTHLEMPFGGTMSSDDFATGTVAAACGGTTSIVDFAIQGPEMTLHQTLECWQNKAQGKAVIDYGLHIAVTRLDEAVLDEIPALVELGVPSFKAFLAYKGALMVDDGTLYKLLRRSKEAGALVMIHAENGEILDVLIKDFLAQGKTEPQYHALSRPSQAEAEATGRGIALAGMAGAPLYIVHLSCREALAKVAEARNAGLPVYAETCPQYLLLSYENYLEPDFAGAKYVMSPPLRDRSNWDPLWQGLASDQLQVVATDHCPFNFKGQKDMGRESFAAIPNGAPGIEHRLQLLFSEGVAKGRIGLNRLVELTATNPAKLFGLYPQKGTVAIGADADLVIFDPEQPFRISAATHHQNVDYTPYEGFTGKGVPKVVLSAGRIIVSDGEFVGAAGAGRFLKRKPFDGAA